MLAVSQAFPADRVGAGVLLHLLRADRIDSTRVQPENLGAQRRCDLGVAVLVAQFRRNLKSAKRLDLILGRAVPNRIGAPQHVVLAAILYQLAQCMRRAVPVAHEKAPGAAELGVNVAVGFDLVFDQRADESVDTVAGAAAIEGALGNSGNKTRVVDEKTYIRKTLGDNADVAALTVLVGLLTERQTLLHADHLHAERARLLDEAGADLIG